MIFSKNKSYLTVNIKLFSDVRYLDIHSVITAGDDRGWGSKKSVLYGGI